MSASRRPSQIATAPPITRTTAAAQRAQRRTGRAPLGATDGATASAGELATSSRWALDRLDGSDEPVTPTCECFNELRRLGGVAKRLTRFLDGRVQAVFEIDECVALPQPLAQILARDEFAWVFEQRDEDLSWMLLEADRCPVVVQLTGRSIELETPEVHARGTGAGVHVAELAGSVAGSTATVNCLRTSQPQAALEQNLSVHLEFTPCSHAGYRFRSAFSRKRRQAR